MFSILADSLMIAARQDQVRLRDVLPEEEQRPTPRMFWRRQGWRDASIKNL